MKFKKLYAEMVARSISINDMAKLINKSEKAVRNRLNGVTEFSYDEMASITREYFECNGNLAQAVFFSEV